MYPSWNTQQGKLRGVEFDIVLSANSADANVMAGNLSKLNPIDLQSVEYASLFKYNSPVYSPVDDIYSNFVDGNLDGLNTNVWMKLSSAKHAKQGVDESDYRTLLVKSMASLQNVNGLEIFVVGDFKEASKVIQSIINFSEFPEKTIDWSSQVPDPYSSQNTNLRWLKHQPETIMSEIHPLYDRYVGEKWRCGHDNTGSLSNSNIITSLENPQNIRYLVIGVLNRPNYILDLLTSPGTAIELYYRLCLAVICNCVQNGVGILKISLPRNKAMKGIYVLFSMYFKHTRLLRFEKSNPDDETCYLFGMEYISRPDTNNLVSTLLNPGVMGSALLYLSTNYPSQSDQTISSQYGDRAKQYTNSLISNWNNRNSN